MKPTLVVVLCLANFTLTTGSTWAGNQYGPGVSDTEIKIGNTMHYSRAASPYGTIGRSEAAYFRMINDQGGINGRKINFLSRDDATSPPKTLEAVRKLVEEDGVLLMFGTAGTPPNTAIQGYLNEHEVPQLFVTSGADKWNDPRHHPWTMSWLPSYRIESRIYARYILNNFPNARIAVLYENDDLGKDYLVGLREGLGSDADKMIVASQSYELTDPIVDSQIITLRGSGADILLIAASAKMAAQSIRKAYDIGWKPALFLTSIATSVKAVMLPAGAEKAIGTISANFLKDPTDPQWQEAPELKEWLAWMKAYNTSANTADNLNVVGYTAAQTMVAVLKACGDNLTRENVMKQAASLDGLSLPMLLPKIKLSTSPDDFAPIKQMQLMKFDGTTWRLFGDVISGSTH